MSDAGRRLPAAGYDGPMWRAVILVALTLSPGALTWAQELPTGTAIESVACLADSSQTYSLYIPTTYSPDRPSAVLMGFHPSARGRALVDLYQTAAERYGYIVAAS